MLTAQLRDLRPQLQDSTCKRTVTPLPTQGQWFHSTNSPSWAHTSTQHTSCPSTGAQPQFHVNAHSGMLVPTVLHLLTTTPTLGQWFPPVFNPSGSHNNTTNSCPSTCAQLQLTDLADSKIPNKMLSSTQPQPAKQGPQTAAVPTWQQSASISKSLPQPVAPLFFALCFHCLFVCCCCKIH